MKPKQEDPKEMVGGCCVCSDENGWTENPLVYCDGQGCTVAVHQACYGIVTVPTGSWYCRKCESTDRTSRVRCELCPSRSGALKRTDSGGWAHVVCALYIPEVRFGNVTTMEPIMLGLVPQERFNKSCYICEEKGRDSRSTIGACMQCNKVGCKQHFHVICAQSMGLLCEEAGNYLDNVKYCGYCQYHYSKLRKGSNVKTIPPYRPISFDDTSEEDVQTNSENKDLKLKKRLNKIIPTIEASKLPQDIKNPVESITKLLTDSPKESDSPAELKVSDHNNTTVPKSENKTDQIISGPGSSSIKVNHCVTAIPPVTVPSTTQLVSSIPVPSITNSLSASTVLTTVNSSRSAIPVPIPHTSSNSNSTPSESVVCSTPVTMTTIPASARGKTESAAGTPPPINETINDLVGDRHRKGRKSGQRTPTSGFSRGNSPSTVDMSYLKETHPEGPTDKPPEKLVNPPEERLTIQFTPNVSAQTSKPDLYPPLETVEKRSRSNSQDRGRRTKRGAPVKRGRGCKENYLKHERDSDDSSRDSFTSEAIPVSKRSRIKKTETKEPMNNIMSNGVGTNALLLGNQINPSSSVAQKMADTLQEEIQAHSIYKDEDKASATLIGPMIPGKRETTAGGTVLGTTQPPPLPQSLEQLLERQWEQGSQFLMEQAQHFDIASLLSCLHQLRQENVRLEENVTSLIARRDHILAVNARLSVPLTAISQTPSAQTNSTTTPSINASPVSHSHNSHPPMGQSHPSAAVNSVLLPSRPHSQGRHPSGGVAHPVNHSSVVRGGTSPHERRVSHGQPPMENGISEPEFRYRQSAGAQPNDFQHRQQSPMLPPGVQPSPNSLSRHSPAAANYHSGSPHTGVPNLSPSAGPPSHNHHHHPPSLMAPSPHAQPHPQPHPSVMSRAPPEHSRAELVRLAGPGPPHSSQQPFNMYQMLSQSGGGPSGPHHTPVGHPHPSHPTHPTHPPHPQPPPHGQPMRRDVVDSGRSSSMDKR